LEKRAGDGGFGCAVAGLLDDDELGLGEALVGGSIVVIGTQGRHGCRYFEKVDTVALLHVVSLVSRREAEVK